MSDIRSLKFHNNDNAHYTKDDTVQSWKKDRNKALLVFRIIPAKELINQ